MRPIPARLAITAILLVLPLVPAFADDAAFSFSPNANPSGVWSYGWAATPGAAFQSFATHSPAPHGRSAWSAGNGTQLSYGCASFVSGGVNVGGPFLNAMPGSAGEATVLRWTAPSAGSYQVNVAFDALGRGPVTLPAASQRLGGVAGAQLGRSLAAAGDLNGDGYTDVVAGEPYYSTGAANRGRVVIYLGGPGGLGLTSTWNITGPAAGALFGSAIACGDINGDGNPDLIVGVPGFTGPSGASQGEALVYFGNGGSFATTPAWTALGAAAGAQFGASVAIADVNGNGYADVIVGAPGESHGQAGEGRAYAWLGSASGLGANGNSGNATWTAESNQAGASFGACLGVLGDLNGDGKADVVVGAPGYDTPNSNGGWIGVYYGSTNGIETLPGFSYTIAQTGAALGASVAGAGDVNGDGYPDLVAGAPGAATGGEALVWLGGANGFTGSPIVLAGTQSGESFGFAVAGAGHFRHGSLPGVLVAAPSYTNGQLEEGAVFLFAGTAGGVSAAPAWTMESDLVNTNLGYTVACAGDVNGDGNDDVAIGAPAFTGTLSHEGRLTVAFDAGGMPAPYTKARVGVWLGGTPLASTVLDQGAAHDTTRANVQATLGAGQSLDIVVAGAGGDPAFAAVSIDADVIGASPPTGPAGPVFALGTQRYAATLGGAAFDAIAWDPTRKQYASNGSMYDSCGTRISAGPDGQALAWDDVSDTYWGVGHDAGTGRWAFLRYSAATGAFVDTVLQIPDKFPVPGIGADTLEDVRGLALDSSFVYVVDAGPANLVPPRNEWFKFTRAGAVVAGRKGASFSVNATGDIVDDIVCAPFSSPTSPGRLIVGIEHTGIDVLDRSGALVETFRWSAQGLAPYERPSAFAGLGLDRVTGDLFLADNDRARMQRWERIPSAAATSYLVGTGSSVAYVHNPGNGCSTPLWQGSWTTSCQSLTLIFGISYRTADQRVYGLDYADGSLWRFNPRSGGSERVAQTGVAGIWGLAYDTGRDVLVGHCQFDNQLYTIAPLSGIATRLPQPAGFSVGDLAFDPVTLSLFGVDRGTTPSHLIRFNRDTGVGTLVGNTAFISGLDYDASLGALVGIGCCSDTLWRVSTSTAATSFLRVRANGEGWEGLAVIPVNPAPALAVGDEPRVAGLLSLAAAPNPWRSAVELTFSLPAARRVDVDVFDIAGRRVRRLVSGPLAAGLHVASWDGRDGRGDQAGPGVYFARVNAAGERVVRTLVRIR